MKNRVKGLLALCLAMCMVLAMTTVAFGATTVYYGGISESGETTMHAGDKITTSQAVVEPTSSGLKSFFVVNEEGDYWTDMNTEANGAHGRAYESLSATEMTRAYFDCQHTVNKEGELAPAPDTFTLPATPGYDYSVRAIPFGATAGDGITITPLYKTQNNVSNDIVGSALMVKLVAKGGYTVKYDLDGGKIGDKTSIDDKTDVKWTDTILTPVGTPTKDGSTFKGWKCQENTTAIIGDTTTYGDLAVTELSSITLVAQWMPAEQLPSTPSTPNETPNAPSGGDTIHRQNVTADTKADTTKTDTIASPKTFDAGVAVYAGLSLLSAAGTAIVIGRKKEF